MGAQQLLRIGIGSLAPTEGNANDVNPIAVENNELIFRDRLRITTEVTQGKPRTNHHTRRL